MISNFNNHCNPDPDQMWNYLIKRIFELEDCLITSFTQDYELVCRGEWGTLDVWVRWTALNIFAMP